MDGSLAADADSFTFTVEGCEPETAYNVSNRLHDHTREADGEAHYSSTLGISGYESDSSGVFTITVPWANIARDADGEWEFASDHMSVTSWLREERQWNFNEKIEGSEETLEVNAP